MIRMTVLVLLSFATISWADDTRPGSDFQPAVLVQFAVADLDRSIEFYRDVLGLEFELRIDELQWARFKTAIDGLTLGLGVQDEVTGSGTTSLNLGVANVPTARARLEEAGVEFLGPTQTIPGVVQLADFLDPDGNKIRLAGHPDSTGP